MLDPPNSPTFYAHCPESTEEGRTQSVNVRHRGEAQGRCPSTRLLPQHTAGTWASDIPQPATCPSRRHQGVVPVPTGHWLKQEKWFTWVVPDPCLPLLP